MNILHLATQPNRHDTSIMIINAAKIFYFSLKICLSQHRAFNFVKISWSTSLITHGKSTSFAQIWLGSLNLLGTLETLGFTSGIWRLNDWLICKNHFTCSNIMYSHQALAFTYLNIIFSNIFLCFFLQFLTWSMTLNG